MPFYDLRCTDCGKEHNISASMKEKSEKLIVCPDCGSKELETVFNAPPAVINNRTHEMMCPSGGGCGGGGCRHAG